MFQTTNQYIIMKIHSPMGTRSPCRKARVVSRSLELVEREHIVQASAEGIHLGQIPPFQGC